MGKGSQTRRRKKIKLAKAKLEVFPEETIERIAEASNDWIPEEVTTVATNVDEAPKKFQISFDHLNWDTCYWKGFSATQGKGLVRLLERVCGCEIRHLPTSGIIRDNINNTRPYTSLFSRLSPDVELKEAELAGGGRVFFFITKHKFHIVSIENQHRDIY